MTGTEVTVHRHRAHRVLGVAAAISTALALGACGGESQVSSSTVATSTSIVATLPSTTAPVTTTPTATTPTTTTPPTEPPATAAPPTTAPATTTPATTASPATSTSPATTAPANPGPATAFVVADSALLEVDAATGATVRVLAEPFGGDGVARGGLRLSPDRSTIWFSEGYEDSWFDCETSIGSFGRIDAATGAIEILGVGSGVEPSADGELISYMTSSLCLPDPEQPEFWVLTPPDRVVVRTLGSGEEREFVTDTPPTDYESPSIVLGAGFAPDGGLLVLLGDGRLFDVDVGGSGVIQDHPVALTEVTGDLAAATADALITVEYGDEGSTDVYSIDRGSGEATLLASAGVVMAVGVSADGQVVVSSFEPVTVAPGAAVAVIELPDDPYVSAIDW